VNPAFVRSDDLARLKWLAVQRDCQRLVNLEARQPGDRDLELQGAGSSDLDVDLRGDFPVGDRRRCRLAAVIVVPP
jgi:hypothetical protein